VRKAASFPVQRAQMRKTVCEGRCLLTLTNTPAPKQLRLRYGKRRHAGQNDNAHSQKKMNLAAKSATSKSPLRKSPNLQIANPLYLYRFPDDNGRQATTDYSGLNPTLSATLSSTTTLPNGPKEVGRSVARTKLSPSRIYSLLIRETFPRVFGTTSGHLRSGNRRLFRA